MEARHKQSILPKRLDSLDVFRGLAIAGMIIVNNPGSWQHIYPVLRHSQWHGCTPADMVFLSSFSSSEHQWLFLYGSYRAEYKPGHKIIF